MVFFSKRDTLLSHYRHSNKDIIILIIILIILIDGC